MTAHCSCRGGVSGGVRSNASAAGPARAAWRRRGSGGGDGVGAAGAGAASRPPSLLPPSLLLPPLGDGVRGGDSDALLDGESRPHHAMAERAIIAERTGAPFFRVPKVLNGLQLLSLPLEI